MNKWYIGLVSQYLKVKQLSFGKKVTWYFALSFSSKQSLKPSFIKISFPWVRDHVPYHDLKGRRVKVFPLNLLIDQTLLNGAVRLNAVLYIFFFILLPIPYVWLRMCSCVWVRACAGVHVYTSVGVQTTFLATNIAIAWDANKYNFNIIPFSGSNVTEVLVNCLEMVAIRCSNIKNVRSFSPFEATENGLK